MKWIVKSTLVLCILLLTFARVSSQNLFNGLPQPSWPINEPFVVYPHYVGASAIFEISFGDTAGVSDRLSQRELPNGQLSVTHVFKTLGMHSVVLNAYLDTIINGKENLVPFASDTEHVLVHDQTAQNPLEGSWKLYLQASTQVCDEGDSGDGSVIVFNHDGTSTSLSPRFATRTWYFENGNGGMQSPIDGFMPILGENPDSIQIDGSGMNYWFRREQIAAVSASVSRHNGFEVFPNPFAGATMLHFSLQRDADITVTLYDALGRTAMRSKLGHVAIGEHDLPLQAGSLAPGAYHALIEAGTTRLETNVVRY